MTQGRTIRLLLLIAAALVVQPTIAELITVNQTNAVARSENGGAAANAFDGGASTRWISDYADPEWIYIDLGEDYDLFKVEIAWEAAHSKDYTLRVRTSAQGVDSPVVPADWTEIASVTGRSGASSQATSEVFNIYTSGTFTPLSGSAVSSRVNRSARGRYLMMHGTSRAIGYGHSIWELRTYGVPAGTKLLAADGYTFEESIDNNGTVTNVVVMGLLSDEFVTSPLVQNIHFTATGVPAGLTAVIVTNSATEAQFTLTGSASPHTAAQDSTVSLMFLDSAFSGADASAVQGASNAFSVSFITAAELTYTPTIYTESTGNNGAVDGGSITLIGDTFSGSQGDDLVAAGNVVVSNLPANLGVIMTRSSDGRSLQVAFTSNAVAHLSANSITDLQFAFQDSAFVTESAASVVGSTSGDLEIRYDDQPTITYDRDIFYEHNNGYIDNASLVVITLSDGSADEAFNGNNGADFINSGKLVVSNVPPGLVAVATKSSDSTLDVSLTGQALANESSDSITNLMFSFQDTAFLADADQVTGSSRADLSVVFNDVVPLLDVTIHPASNQVDLTEAGPLDWFQWTGSTPVTTRKLGGTAMGNWQSSFPTPGTHNPNAAISFTWTDGGPTLSGVTNLMASMRTAGYLYYSFDVELVKGHSYDLSLWFGSMRLEPNTITLTAAVPGVSTNYATYSPTGWLEYREGNVKVDALWNATMTVKIECVPHSEFYLGGAALAAVRIPPKGSVFVVH